MQTDGNIKNTTNNDAAEVEENTEKRKLEMMDILPHLTFSGFPSRRRDIHASANAPRSDSSISELLFSRAQRVKLARGPAPSVFRKTRLVCSRVPCSGPGRCRHFARVSLVDWITNGVLATSGERFYCYYYSLYGI